MMNSKGCVEVSSRHLRGRIEGNHECPSVRVGTRKSGLPHTSQRFSLISDATRSHTLKTIIKISDEVSFTYKGYNVSQPRSVFLLHCVNISRFRGMQMLVSL